MPKIKVKDQKVQTGERPQTNGRTHTWTLPNVPSPRLRGRQSTTSWDTRTHARETEWTVWSSTTDPVCGAKRASNDNLSPLTSWSSTLISVPRLQSVFHFSASVRPTQTQPLNLTHSWLYQSITAAALLLPHSIDARANVRYSSQWQTDGQNDIRQRSNNNNNSVCVDLAVSHLGSTSPHTEHRRRPRQLSHVITQWYVSVSNQHTHFF